MFLENLTRNMRETAFDLACFIFKLKPDTFLEMIDVEKSIMF